MAGYIIYSLDWPKFRQVIERPTKEQLAALAALVRDELAERDGEFDENDSIMAWPDDEPGLKETVATRLALPEWYGDLSIAGKGLWESVIFNACMNHETLDVGFRADSDGVYWDVIELAWKRLSVVPNTISDIALSAFGTRPYRYHALGGPAKSRPDYDLEQGDRHESMKAMGEALGQFVAAAKRGDKDPNDLMKEIEKNQGVSAEHKAMMRELLDDDDSDDDDDDFAAWTPMHSMHTPEEVQKMLAELQSIAPAVKAAKKKDVRADYEEELMPAIEEIARDGRMLFIQVDT
jgi:hypothetical protein